MYIALTVLIIIACVLLVLAVLVQNPKGGGLAVGFSASNQVMGVRKTTDFLEKLTWGLLISLIVFCLVGTIILPSSSQKGAQSILQEKAENAAANPQTSAPAPSQPAPQAPAQNQTPPGQNPGQ